jgi:ATP-dependent DNA helicase RecG
MALTADELRELSSRESDRAAFRESLTGRDSIMYFDHHPVSGATIADLNMTLFESVYLPSAISPDILSANERTPQQQLASLRLATTDGQPTYGGMLVLGKDVLSWLPGAYIQFLRIDGVQLTDPILDQKTLSGPLPDLLRLLDSLLAINVQVKTDLSASIEARTPDYPIRALEQIARNGVMHRSYQGTNAPLRIYWFTDRIEILSPGGPYGLVSRENFGTEGLADYRNPLVAEAMRVLGYVQRFGWGIPAARRAVHENGNPPMEFDVRAEFVLAIVRRRP